jgi:hypothetical protein
MNLSKSELDTFKLLRKNTSIVICKPDKGNGVVVLDRSDYNAKLMKLISDPTKFVELHDDPTMKREKSLQEYLYYLKTKGIFDESTYQKIRPRGSKPARIYGLPKLHKPDVPLRPIVSSIGTYTYELSKYLAEILKPLINSDYTVKDSFSFASEILSLDNVNFMCSFDVVSLFTNIPLEQTLDICLDTLFSNCIKVNNLTRRQLKKLLTHAAKENHFMFEGKMFDQIDGVAMGSSLGPILANIFMTHFENKALSEYTRTLPSTYRRYVDDTFLIFEDQADMDEFFHYLNNQHNNIKFTKEIETDNTLAFLDVFITRNSDGTLSTSVYRKPQFTGLYLRWDSFVPKQYKKGLVNCLIYRAWRICSCLDNFYSEVDFIKSILVNNGYPQNFILSVVRKFMHSKFSSDIKEPVYGPEKKPIYINLPFCGTNSLKIGRQLKRMLGKVVPWTKLILIFKPINKLNCLSQLKSPYNVLSLSNVIYRINCSDCDEFYIGMTERILQNRINEHSKAETSSVYSHAQQTNHNINYSSPAILAHDNIKLRLQVKESFLIKEQAAYNSLNRNTGSFPLILW